MAEIEAADREEAQMWAKTLLAAADKNTDVQTEKHPDSYIVFVVPDELYDKVMKERKAQTRKDAKAKAEADEAAKKAKEEAAAAAGKTSSGTIRPGSKDDAPPAGQPGGAEGTAGPLADGDGKAPPA